MLPRKTQERDFAMLQACRAVSMWFCNIHQEEFNHDEHGGCPSCMEEWESPDMRDLVTDDPADGDSPEHLQG